MKTCFIANPRSGGASRVLPRVQAFAAEQGAKLILTTRRHHATELAEEALRDGCGLIVAVGGDGTLNEVAKRLIGTPAILGLVPCGSGNGLGRHLGIHGPVPHMLEILRTGRPRLIDTGVADGHPFFVVAGLGFEAEVSAHFNQLTGRGFLRYLTASARLWRSHVPEEVRITYPGGNFTASIFTLAVANCDQYGNGALIAPGARVDDGQLDLTAVPPVGLLSAIPLFARLFAGSLGRIAGVERRQATRFLVERPEPGLIHTDGETHEAGVRVEFSLRPHSLRIMAPPRDELELLPVDPELAVEPAPP